MQSKSLREMKDRLSSFSQTCHRGFPQEARVEFINSLNLTLNGVDMIYCHKCGTELKDEARFCHSCGTPVSRPEKREAKRTRYRAEREACFGPPGSGGGLWGAISFGVFIIGLGLLLYYNLLWPGILILIGLMILIGSLVAVFRQR